MHKKLLQSNYICEPKLTRRGRIELLNLILEEATQGANKTRITYRVNLNFVRASKYIKFLENKGLLAMVNGNPGIYKTTDRGKKYLESYKDLVKTIK
jgi:predicted transcriptional regulator